MKSTSFLEILLKHSLKIKRLSIIYQFKRSKSEPFPRWYFLKWVNLFNHFSANQLTVFYMMALHRKWSFHYGFFSKCDEFPADLVIFTEEILNEKCHSLVHCWSSGHWRVWKVTWENKLALWNTKWLLTFRSC